jgi:hypothetical protein
MAPTLKNMRTVLALATLALATCGAARAAAPVVPTDVQRQLKVFLAQLGAADLAFVPTRLPSHYAFESYSVTGSPVGLDVSLLDQRLLRTPARARVSEVSFDTAYVKGRCSSKSRKILRVGSSRVYSDGTTVWQCSRTPRGRLVRTSAHGRLAPAALAALVVSARPVR